jgi:hypothetical protein
LKTFSWRNGESSFMLPKQPCSDLDRAPQPALRVQQPQRGCGAGAGGFRGNTDFTRIRYLSRRRVASPCYVLSGFILMCGRSALFMP